MAHVVVVSGCALVVVTVPQEATLFLSFLPAASLLPPRCSSELGRSGPQFSSRRLPEQNIPPEPFRIRMGGVGGGVSFIRRCHRNHIRRFYPESGRFRIGGESYKFRWNYWASCRPQFSPFFQRRGGFHVIPPDSFGPDLILRFGSADRKAEQQSVGAEKFWTLPKVGISSNLVFSKVEIYSSARESRVCQATRVVCPATSKREMAVRARLIDAEARRPLLSGRDGLISPQV